MFDYPNGTCNLDGAAKARCRIDGRKDDADHNYVPKDKAQNGGIRVPESLHSFE